ncbi:MAG: hypothetical protein LBI64_03630 [Coriobacteriales bacterium]|nr:hypothetical protein [Coriobacteriales bacterium]
MKIRPGTVVMSCVVVAILAAGVAFGFYLKQERIDRAPDEWAFFYEERELFEDVKDEFMALGIEGSVDREGYLVRDDGSREWYPDLAEAAIRLFKKVPYRSPDFTSYFMTGGMTVEFGFSSNGIPKFIVFVYSKDDLTELFGLNEMDRNWYCYWLPNPA